jgi:nitrate/TMAO reductase-like tetraheme cytochrome c subunit
MKSFGLLLLLVVCVIFFASTGSAFEKNKYVGVKQCSMCHKSEKAGKQFDIWSKSKHAEAYKTLTTAKADEIAKAKGLKTKAAESAECLGCHTVTAEAALLDKTFDVKDGVQCESCHGAGSAYKNMAVMKDKAKAEAAGLMIPKDEAAIEKFCVTCHNDKSPSFKEFKFKPMWEKIKHDIPKKG